MGVPVSKNEDTSHCDAASDASMENHERLNSSNKSRHVSLSRTTVSRKVRKVRKTTSRAKALHANSNSSVRKLKVASTTTTSGNPEKEVPTDSNTTNVNPNIATTTMTIKRNKTKKSTSTVLKRVKSTTLSMTTTSSTALPRLAKEGEGLLLPEQPPPLSQSEVRWEDLTPKQREGLKVLLDREPLGTNSSLDSTVIAKGAPCVDPICDTMKDMWQPRTPPLPNVMPFQRRYQSMGIQKQQENEEREEEEGIKTNPEKELNKVQLPFKQPMELLPTYDPTAIDYAKRLPDNKTKVVLRNIPPRTSPSGRPTPKFLLKNATGNHGMRFENSCAMITSSTCTSFGPSLSNFSSEALMQCDVDASVRDKVDTIYVETAQREFIKCLPISLLHFVTRAVVLQLVSRKFPTSTLAPTIYFSSHSDLKGWHRGPAELDMEKLENIAPLTLRFRFDFFRERLIISTMSIRLARSLVKHIDKTKKRPHTNLKGHHHSEDDAKDTPKKESDDDSSKDAQPHQDQDELDDRISREMAAAFVLRPHITRDILFGDILPQGVVRPMSIGSRLFRPGVGGWSDKLTPRGSGNNVGSLGVKRLQLRRVKAFGISSYEFLPSIFRKLDKTMDSENINDEADSQGSKRESSPHEGVDLAYFQREFIATLAVGALNANRFAVTLLPEFLVSMKSFYKQPDRALVSAIRATFHNMYNLIAKELTKNATVMSLPSRLTIRGPSVDISTVYIRDEIVYYASTQGILGKAFFFGDSPRRRIIDMPDEIGAPRDRTDAFSGSLRGSHDETGCGSHSHASNATSWTSRTFELPQIRHGTLDLKKVFEQYVPRPPSRPVKSNPTGRLSNLTNTSCDRPPLSFNRGETVGAVDSVLTMASGTPSEKLDGPVPPPESLPNISTDFLPHVIVLATGEFWSEISPTAAWELMRWMMLLDCEAISNAFPKSHLAELTSFVDDVPPTTPCLDALRSSIVLHSRIKRYLERFYKKRHENYILENEQNANSRQEQFDELVLKQRFKDSAKNTPLGNESLRNESHNKGLGEMLASMLSTAAEHNWTIWQRHDSSLDTMKETSIGMTSCERERDTSSSSFHEEVSGSSLYAVMVLLIPSNPPKSSNGKLSAVDLLKIF